MLDKVILTTLEAIGKSTLLTQFIHALKCHDPTWQVEAEIEKLAASRKVVINQAGGVKSIKLPKPYVPVFYRRKTDPVQAIKVTPDVLRYGVDMEGVGVSSPPDCLYLKRTHRTAPVGTWVVRENDILDIISDLEFREKFRLAR